MGHDRIKIVKTTVELPDALLEEAKRLAARQGLTLKQLLEMGLRQTIAAQKPSEPFRLRKHTVGGKGLVEDIDWPGIRERIYDGRGG